MVGRLYFSFRFPATRPTTPDGAPSAKRTRTLSPCSIIFRAVSSILPHHSFWIDLRRLLQSVRRSAKNSAISGLSSKSNSNGRSAPRTSSRPEALIQGAILNAMFSAVILSSGPSYSALTPSRLYQQLLIFLSARLTMERFSPISGATSAIVPNAARSTSSIA